MYFKKLSNFFLCAALAATSLGLASCSDDDNKGDEPDPGTEVTSAIYVVNNGVQTGNVPGGITVYDLNTGKSPTTASPPPTPTSASATLPRAPSSPEGICTWPSASPTSYGYSTRRLSR